MHRRSVPAIALIRRLITELSEDDRHSYMYFQWPGSMQSAGLPWEAAAACLDLVRHRVEHQLPLPLVSEATWFWRV
jgi:hypothetical protein